MIIAPTGYLNPIKNFVYNISSPFLETGTILGAKLSNSFSGLINIGKLAKKNKALEEENLHLKSENALLVEVSHQNEILKEELGFREKNQEKKELIPAQVIGYSPSSFLEYIIINKGKKDGLKENQPVISRGYLIGKLIEVENNTAKVFLIINNKSLIPVILQESKGTGLLRGGLGGLTVNNIAIDTPIKVGENVVSSGSGGIFPSGIIIGRVEKIISQSSSILQSVLIKSPIEFGKLQIVFIQK